MAQSPKKSLSETKHVMFVIELKLKRLITFPHLQSSRYVGCTQNPVQYLDFGDSICVRGQDFW